jgi:hypothetical protein
MLEIVVGGLIEPPSAKIRYTFCQVEDVSETGLGFHLTPEGSLAATAVFMRMQNPAPPFAKTQGFAPCSAPLCHFKEVRQRRLKPHSTIATWFPAVLNYVAP